MWKFHAPTPVNSCWTNFVILEGLEMRQEACVKET